MADAKEIVDHLLNSAIAVISRRTSDNYAVIVVGNTIRNLQRKYNFLNYIEILNTQYIETEQFIAIDVKINKTPQKELAAALREFVEMITTSIGRNAGFFFIRELKDYMGFQWHIALRQIDVDLDLLQYGFTFDRIQRLAKSIDAAEIVKKLLKSTIDISKHILPYRHVISKINELIEELIPRFKFLENITVDDIRFTLGNEEIYVNKMINTVSIEKLSEATEIILIEINKTLEETGYFSFVNELNRMLGSEYRVKMEELNFSLKIQQFGLQILIKKMLVTTLNTIQTLELSTDPSTLVQKTINDVAERYPFLDYITITKPEQNTYQNSITFTSDIQDASGLAVGRALKLIIQHIMQTFPNDDALIFIKELRSSLDQEYITKLEVMGLNLYMLQLRQEIQVTA
jgi:hypothetical protein